MIQKRLVALNAGSRPLVDIKTVTAEQYRAILPGKVIKVIATDPASVKDMPAFARNTGHELLHAARSGSAFEFYFRKQEEEAE